MNTTIPGRRLRAGRLRVFAGLLASLAIGSALLVAPAPAALADEAGALAGQAEADCTSLPLAPFGDPGTAVGQGSMEPGSTACLTFTAEAGLYSVRLGSSGISPRLVVENSAGESQCGAALLGACRLSEAGTYTIRLESESWGSSTSYEVSVVPLDSMQGCAAPVGTSWDLPLLQKTRQSKIQLDCQPIEASAGERLLVRSPVSVYGDDAASWIVDQDGADACPRDFDHDGCVLQGTGPFRVLSYLEPSVAPDEYRLDIGRLSNAVGCTPAVPTTFGVVPPEGPAGSRCRELTIETPSTYVIDTRQQGDESSGGRGAYGSDGLPACEALTRCTFTQPGKYTLLAVASARIAIFPVASTDGCVPQTADSFVGLHGVLAANSQYDCLLLSSPAGATVLPTVPVGSTSTSGSVLDAAGNFVCGWNRFGGQACKLTGTGPFRALVRTEPFHAPGSYDIAVPRLDGATGCAVLPQGDFTAPGGVSNALRADRFATCLTVPAASHADVEAVQYSRTSTAGKARFEVINAAGEQKCQADPGTTGFAFCSLAKGESYTVVLVGTAEDATYRVTRRDVTSTARGCIPAGSTAIGATAGTGTIADASVLRCHKVTGAATDQFVVNMRDAKGSIQATVFRPSGASVCYAFADLRCPARGSTSYQVVVWNDASSGPGGPYKLEASRIASASTPAPECTKVASSAYGFGPVTGDLTATRTTACVAFAAGRVDVFNGTATNQTNAAAGVVLRGFGLDGRQTCFEMALGGAFECDGSATSSNQVLLVSLPRNQTQARFTVAATCRQPLCGAQVFGLRSVSPMSAPAGATATVTVAGSALHLKDVVQFTAAGKPTITGSVRSVAADRKSAVVAVNLTTAPTGARNLVVRSFSGRTATLANVFTVTPKPLKVITAPAVIGPVRVGVVIRASVGTWTPAATGYRYQWRDGTAAITGATGSAYAVPAARLGHRLSVTVTATRAGSGNGVATSAGVLVARGTASRALTAPVISGIPQVRRTVKTSNGTWTPGCTSYGYQWYSGGRAITGATRSYLLLTAVMAHKTLVVASICHRTGFYDGRSVSKSVAVRP